MSTASIFDRRHRAFRAFWLSFTLSALGDVLTRVSLTWFVYERTQSPEALGLLALTYTGPVIVGGLLAGSALDRFDRRKVMIADNLIRGSAVLLIPMLHALGTLELWHVYVISTVYGSLVMVSLAGSPALVPDLVDAEVLHTANALETLSYTLSGIVAPVIAGFLIPRIGAPNVIFFDALTYFALALTLTRIAVSKKVVEKTVEAVVSYRLSDAVRLLRHNGVLLSTTLMFMAANLGFGALNVGLPILAGTAEAYGLLLGAVAVGEVISSVLAGVVKLPVGLGVMICAAQVLSGLSLLILFAGIASPPAAIVSLALFGFFSAPLTIWAQTLRMKVIPPEMRGRMFALLRTLMQSTGPLGGAAGGVLLTALTLPVMVVLSALIVGVPGLMGYAVKSLRQA